jgi:hypothetical protein
MRQSALFFLWFAYPVRLDEATARHVPAVLSSMRSATSGGDWEEVQRPARRDHSQPEFPSGPRMQMPIRPEDGEDGNLALLCYRSGIKAFPSSLFVQPRPTNGILVAMIVMFSTFVSRGKFAMWAIAFATAETSIIGSIAISPLACFTPVAIRFENSV